MSALLPSPGTSTIQSISLPLSIKIVLLIQSSVVISDDIGLYDINDAKGRSLTGTIVVTAEYTQELHKEAGDAELLKIKDVVGRQLGPGSLFEKVGKLQDKLEKLDGIVSTIDELVKVFNVLLRYTCRVR